MESNTKMPERQRHIVNSLLRDRGKLYTFFIATFMNKPEGWIK